MEVVGLVQGKRRPLLMKRGVGRSEISGNHFGKETNNPWSRGRVIYVVVRHMKGWLWEGVRTLSSVFKRNVSASLGVGSCSSHKKENIFIDLPVEQDTIAYKIMFSR